MMKMFLSLSTLLTLTSFTSAVGIRGVGGLCDCSGTRPGGRENAAYICRDERLGTMDLLPGTLVDRFGSERG
jgi:hypothetical protein